MIEWRTVLVLVAFVAAAAFAAYSKIFFGVPSQFTLINHAAETVSEARLMQGDHELAVVAVEHGRIRTTDFIAREGSLTLRVKFNSGRSLSADSVGYVAAGMPVVVVFEVNDDKVALLTVTQLNPNSASGRRL